MRGEDPSIIDSTEMVSGSPPHARGRRVVPFWITPVKGITPACAGKTCCRRGSKPSCPDHPRMRGEDRVDANPTVHPPWITPACAGKTDRAFA